MINNIYSLKNVLSGRFNDIFEFPTDSFAEARVKEFAEKNTNFNLKENELYRIGAIEVETGLITALTEPLLIKIDLKKGTIETEETQLDKKRADTLLD